MKVLRLGRFYEGVEYESVLLLLFEIGSIFSE